jgi:hypothetical protein
MHSFDPLDRELLDRAIDAVDAASGEDSSLELDSDETLEEALDREIMDIAKGNGVTDPKSIREFISPRTDQVGQPLDQVAQVGAGIAASALAAGVLTMGLVLLWITTLRELATAIIESQQQGNEQKPMLPVAHRSSS